MGGAGESKAILFSDLDGTFLDQETYLPGPALDAAFGLLDAGIGVVFCSAKTRSELLHLLQDFGFEAPFIVENGAAVASREGILFELGRPYEDVADDLAEAAAEVGIGVRGYGDMTIPEISEVTGLGSGAAARARDREYSVTFHVTSDEDRLDALADALAERGLRMVRGARFFSAQGHHDKGMAIRRYLGRLQELPPTFGVGDYGNDVEMLAAVDYPMLVQRPDGRWADVPVPGIHLLDGIGPAGWVMAAHRILDEVGRVG